VSILDAEWPQPTDDGSVDVWEVRDVRKAKLAALAPKMAKLLLSLERMGHIPDCVVGDVCDAIRAIVKEADVE